MAIVRNILVRVGADISELQKNMQDASKYMKKAGKQLANVGQTLTTSVTLPLAVMGGAVVKAAADFEQGMANVKAVSGATGDEMAKLKDLAIDMGAKTKYSASEAAKGIEELIKAGVSATDIMGGGLESALTLASAGEIELADAAEIASTALNAFKKDSLSVGKAADILAGAANASATDIMELKLGLSQASAVASGAGFTFQDTATALAVFAQNGLKGSDAGTSLKTMLLNLQPSSKEAAKEMERLGLITKDGSSTFYDANGKIKSLADISEVLKTKLGGLTDQQRQMALKTMFGTDAIRAANILYKEGADGANKMATEMGKVSAAQVAAEKMNTFNGALEKLKGNLETVAIQLGSIILPALNDLVTKYLSPLVEKFSALDASMQKTIIVLAGLAAGLGPVLWILGQVVGVFGSMTGFIAGALKAVSAFSVGTTGLGATMTAIFGPAGVVLLAIAAVAALGYAIYKTVKYAMGDAVPEINLFGENISEATKKAVGGYVDLDNKATAALTNLKFTSGKVSKETADSLIKTFDNMGTMIKQGMDKHFQQSFETMQNFFAKSKVLTDTEEAVALGKLKTNNEAKKAEIDAGEKRIAEILATASTNKRALTLAEQVEINKIQESMRTNAVAALSQTEIESKAIIERMKQQAGDLSARQAVEVAQNSLKQKESAVKSANEQYNAVVAELVKQRDEAKTISAGQADKLIADATRQRDEVVKKAEDMHKQVIDQAKLQAKEHINEVDWEAAQIKSKWDAMLDTLGRGWKKLVDGISQYKFEASAGRNSGNSHNSVPYMAKGGIVTGPTLAMIGEGRESEAILPLSKLQGLMGSGEHTTNVYLDGKLIFKHVDNGLGAKTLGMGVV